jgi:GNAT superfamily N-acetyltransferase
MIVRDSGQRQTETDAGPWQDLHVRSDIRVRPAGHTDMAGVRRIAGRFGLLSHWPTGPDFLDCEREYGHLAVASRYGDPGLIGFGGVLRRDGITHLGDLFVDDRHQSGGVGRALLDEVMDGAADRVTFASADPRAVPLYIRYGMFPRCPMYYLSGSVTSKSTVDIVDVETVVPLDEEASGGERASILHWYAGLPGVRVYAGPDGYAFIREVDGEVHLGPAAGTETALGAAAALPGRTLHVALFGVHPLLPRLLAAGLRIGDTDTYLASDDDLVPLDWYVPHPDLG